MALLRIFKNEQLQREIELQPGRTYTAGRNDDCEIPLDSGRGISRRHFEISKTDSGWMLQGFSRYRELYVGGEKIETWPLNDATQFEVPPYRFEFIPEQAKEALVRPEEPQAIPPEPPLDIHLEEPLSKISVTSKKKGPSPEVIMAEESESSFNVGERTIVQSIRSAAYIRAENDRGRHYKTFKLEGYRWIAGRDTACTIFLDNPIFSRNHFEIKAEEGAYLIRDLGSSNGTSVNSTRLKENEWNILNSGDEITVLGWTLLFELRHNEFERKLKLAAPPLRFTPELSAESPIGQPSSAPPNMNGPMVFSSSGGGFEWNPVRILMVLLVIGGAFGYLLQSPTEKVQIAEGASQAPSSPFDRLNPQQQQYVRDSYRLADSLFKQGRYELARQEVAKIHQLVPSFEESKNIEKLAEVALQTQLDQQRAEAQEAERRQMEEKIVQQVSECRRKFTRATTPADVDRCLEPVVAFNPDHPQIIALKADAEKLEAERQAANERREEYQERTRRQAQLFNRAESVLRSEGALAAIPHYQAVIRSSLPDPQDLKGKARRKIASLQSGMDNQQSSLERQAEDFYRNGDLKNAILTIQRALKINPNNEVIKGRKSAFLDELKKKMQATYQEGVLEESVGEVESAKAKWKKIIDLSVPDEEYYKKARMKLKKYGAF